MRPTLAIGSESTRNKKQPVDYGPPEVKKAFNPLGGSSKNNQNTQNVKNKPPIEKQESSVGN